MTLTALWHLTPMVFPVGLASQFVGGKFTVQYILDKFKGDMHPGEVFLTNDPYHGGNTHLPDWGFFRPIFYQGELIFFTLCRAHMTDTGGAFPGGYFPNGYDIHAEGICIPPIKVIEEGREREDVMGLLLNNVRFRDAVREEIRKIPDGTYFGESATDDDGTVLTPTTSPRSASAF